MNIRNIGRHVVGATWLRLAGAVCVAAIAVLSLVPRDMKPVDAATVPGTAQHLFAYAVAAVLLGLGARIRLNPVILIAALGAYSGVLEVLQIWAPGREPAVEGFLWSSLGAAIGATVASFSRTS